MRDGKTSFQQKRSGAEQSIKQPGGHPFQVGETYANRLGNYEVLEIAPPRMTVRYEDGRLWVGDIEILARIWGNLQLPEEVPEPRPRQRTPATPSQTRVPRQRRSPGDRSAGSE
jgi:hypothetical protein